MLIKILIAVAIIVVVFLIVVAMQSSTYRVARTVLISAPPAAVFANVNDFHKWEAWNPWGKIDPAMTQTYSGAPSGPGAAYAWVGNNEVGEGRMTIADSRPSDMVKVNLEFIKPFAATAIAEFTFKPRQSPTGEQTEVTWSMTGDKNFMAKAIHLFMNMDKMLGGQFDKGLADLKKVAETTGN